MKKKNKKSKNYIKKKLVLLTPISFLLLLMAQSIPNFAEHIYAKYIYKFLSQALGILTGWIPFSIMEWQVVAFPILIVVSCFIIIWKFFHKPNQRKELLIYTFWNLASICSVILFLFVTTCGLNYYRDTFTTHSGLEIRKYSKQELQELCFSLTEKANILRAQLLEDESGVVTYSFKNSREMSKEAARAMKKLAETYPVLKGIYPAPKSMIFSKVMSRMELTGIFWGFTMEANVNTDVLDFKIPATMCHELSHLRGFMREDEANYIGYLACVNSDKKELQYSGVMMALIYAGNQLYETDKELYWAVRKTYSEGIERDLVADSEYWKPYENTIVSEVSNKMNDSYLKANNQMDGVKSYGRMVDLLLAEYTSKK